MFKPMTLIALALVLLASSAIAEPATVRTDDDVALHVRVTGEGEPVLLLTGGPGFAGGYLEGVAEHVAQTRLAILPDQRGTGRSRLDPFDATAFSIRRSVADLEQIREALGHESWTLVGHSWGGVLAMHYAAEHPERVANLVLVNSGGIDASFARVYQANIIERMSDDARAELSAIRPKEQTLAAFGRAVRASNRVMADAMTSTPEAARALRETWFAEDQFNPSLMVILQRAIAGYDLRGRIGVYTGPATVLHGESDPIGFETAEGLSLSLRDAPLVTIEGAAHWPFLEVPEVFFPALDDALAAASSPGLGSGPSDD